MEAVTYANANAGDSGGGVVIGESADVAVWNSTISTKGTNFARANIKNMYLERPLD